MGHERLIKTFTASSLEWACNGEACIDRVAAIGFASRYNDVGEAMLRVDALDPEALRKVILLVIRRLNRQFNIERSFAERMAFATLHEYMRPNCIYCGGKGDVFQQGAVVQVCSYCDGSGLHRYSDRDRKALIGGGYNTRAYENAIAYVRDAVRAIVVSTNGRLD